MKIGVSISKTFQERQYEPFNITLSTEVEADVRDDAEARKLYKHIYSEIVSLVDELIIARINKTAKSVKK